MDISIKYAEKMLKFTAKLLLKKFKKSFQLRVENKILIFPYEIPKKKKKNFHGFVTGVNIKISSSC